MTIKEEIISKGNEIFNCKYDYSKVGEIRTKKEKFIIICPKHGEFIKNYNNHIIRKQGCPECIGKKRYTTEEFINKCKKLEHTSEMSFENTIYVNNKTKVKIFCHHVDENGIEHGEFEITPGHLLNGEGCPKCLYIKSANGRRRNIEEIIKIANDIHNNKYEYSLITVYKNDREKYPIICPKHGVFYQTMNNHISNKQGCPTCAHIKNKENRTLTTEEFIEKCKEVHGDKYDYSMVEYLKSENKVFIKCKKHGVFKQQARNHLFGQGCPKCFKEKSKTEKELFEYIKELLPNVIVEENNRTVLEGKEIDVYIPSMNIGFEMNGLIWHSTKYEMDSNYHLNKTLKSNEKGIKLIHIFEDEWSYKKDICKHIIRNELGLLETITTFECKVKTINKEETIQFLEENNLYGKVDSDINIGFFYKGELIEIVCFKSNETNENCYMILAHCYKNNKHFTGGFFDVMQYFIDEYKPYKISINIDRRFNNLKQYELFGFKIVEEENPKFLYVKNKKRIQINEIQNDENINDMFKVYDCGYYKMEWTKNE